MPLEPTIKKLVLHAAVLSTPYAAAAHIQLSEAFNYNVFIFNDNTGNQSDVEGKLAVGGDLMVKDFDVGLLLTPDLASSTLYVGDDMDYIRGQVHGGQVTVFDMIAASQVSFDGALNAVGNVSLNGVNVETGGIFTKGDASLEYAGINSDDIEAEGAASIKNAGLDDGEVIYGTTLTVVDGNNGDNATQDPSNTVDVNNLDFASIANEVTAQSSAFANMEVNGTTTLKCGGVDCTDVAT